MCGGGRAFFHVVVASGSHIKAASISHVKANANALCPQRIYVHASLYDAFVAQFAEFVKKEYKLGDPSKDGGEWVCLVAFNLSPCGPFFFFDVMMSVLRLGEKRPARHAYHDQ